MALYILCQSPIPGVVLFLSHDKMTIALGLDNIPTVQKCCPVCHERKNACQSV